MISEDYPARRERALRVLSPFPLIQAMADLLEKSGFRLYREGSPALPTPAMREAPGFFDTIAAVRDQRGLSLHRTQGGILVLVGLVSIGIAGGLMIAGGNPQNPVLVAGILLAVLLGGSGLSRLGEVPQVVRHAVHIEFKGGHCSTRPNRWGIPDRDLQLPRDPGLCELRVTLHAGVGIAKGASGIARWMDVDHWAFLTAPAGPARAAAVPLPVGSPLRLDRVLDGLVEDFKLSVEGREQ